MYNLLDIMIRLIIAGILAGAIGLERELRAKEAGFRTHFLVGVGAALIMIVSKYGFSDVLKYDHIGLDPSRIAAQVVSGVGFLGAGTIILEKRFVKGLTTAAGIWTTAGIGIAIGSGLYAIGILATILVLVGLEILQIVFRSVMVRYVDMTITLLKNSDYEILKFLKGKKESVIDYKITKLKGANNELTYQIDCRVKTKMSDDFVLSINKLEEMDGVISIEIKNP